MTSGRVYRVGPFLAVAGLIAILAGCGRNAFFQEQRAAWRGEAETQCMRSGAVKRSQFIQPIGAVNGPGTCGMDQGLRVTALANGTVGTVSRQTLGCPMVAGLDRWLDEVVQPAAQATYGAAVVEMKSGSYACRGRNGQPGAKISEHGFGNGADIFSFRFADGREVTVKNGWRGAPDEQHFLRTVFVGACKQFRTVLGPGADAFHYDHFHLDLAMHDPRGVRTVCKPVLKFDPVPYEGI
ncbi:MAG: extensin family protein, partial [Beijerinckiaceae bacterium]